MKIEKEVWLAKDSDDEIRVFASCPQKQRLFRTVYWTADSQIDTLRLFSPDISKYIENSIDLMETPIKVKLTLET